MKKIYVDSNIFLDAEIKERQKHKESKMFLEHCLKHPNIRVCTSVFTLLEIASAIRRQVGKRDVYQYLYNIHIKYKEGQVEWLFPSKVKTTYDFKKTD